jgi:hypothetical protein
MNDKLRHEKVLYLDSVDVFDEKISFVVITP